MAVRKKKKPVRKEVINRVLAQMVNGGVSGALGMTVGMIEEGISEEAATVATATMTAVGFIGGVLVDPATNPNWSAVMDKSYTTGTNLGGRKLGVKVIRTAKEVRHKRDMDRLRADLMAEGFAPAVKEEDDAKAADVVPIPKRRKATPKNGKIAEL